MNRLRILIVVLALVAACIHYVKQERMQRTIPEGTGLVIDKDWLAVNNTPITPKKHRRAAENTFWVYPEWYLVHSPAEQADYFKTHTATTLSYVTHHEQFWDSYHVLSEQMEGNFEFNSEYHTMVMVIGVSTSMEYLMKAWYEKVVGRVTDTKTPVTAEDQFNAAYMQSYVDFIRKEPWFNFNYWQELQNLWTQTSWFGSNMLRKWERKYVLTSEFLFKGAYGQLMKMGSESVFGESLLSTVVLVDKLPEKIGATATVLELFPDSSALISLPRYAAFIPAIQQLANQQVNVLEVAGNNSAILLSVLSSKEMTLDLPKGQRLFTQTITSKKDEQRIVFVTPIADLCTTLRSLERQGIGVGVEHIYDF
jgi:hypothetical protein